MSKASEFGAATRGLKDAHFFPRYLQSRSSQVLPISLAGIQGTWMSCGGVGWVSAPVMACNSALHPVPKTAKAHLGRDHRSRTTCLLAKGIGLSEARREVAVIAATLMHIGIATKMGLVSF